MHMDLRRMSLGQLAQLLQQISREIAGRDRHQGGHGGGNFNTYNNAGTYGYGGSPSPSGYGGHSPSPYGGGGGGFHKGGPRKPHRRFGRNRPDFPQDNREPREPRGNFDAGANPGNGPQE